VRQEGAAAAGVTELRSLPSLSYPPARAHIVKKVMALPVAANPLPPLRLPPPLLPLFACIRQSSPPPLLLLFDAAAAARPAGSGSDARRGSKGGGHASRPRRCCSSAHHLRLGGGKFNCEAVARARESMPAELLDVLREAKRPASSFLKSRVILSPAFWPQSFAPLPFLSRLLCSSPCPRAPWPSHPRSPPCSASLTLALTFLSAAAVVAPLLFLPADAAAVTARQLLEFPPPRMCQQGQRGKRGEAKNGGITDVVRSFKEEQVEELERMGVAFRSRPVRNAAARQVQLLMDFLKVRFFPSFFLLFMKETDIGRYVNGLRKHPLGRSQEAGEVAHQFERKWKEVMDG